MIRTHSKIVSFLLIGLFLYSSFGFLLVYLPAKTIIRHTISKAITNKEIKKEDLSTLAFDMNKLNSGKYDFEWEKPGKEFKFNGKMYDIEEKKIQGDSVFYVVYYDHKESILEELFVIHSTKNDNDKNNNLVQRVILLGLFTEIISKDPEKESLRKHIIIPLQKNEAAKINFLKDIPTPPPRIII